MSDVDEHLGVVNAGDAPPPKRVDHPLRGIALVLLSTVFLGTADALGKYLAGSLPAVEVAWLRLATMVVVTLGVLLATGFRAGLRTDYRGLQVMRGFLFVIGVVTYIVALPYVRLADATAIGFSSPLMVTLLSVIVLGEVVGWRRWSATIAGFIGVMIVARPGSSTFHPALMLPALTAITWAFCVIITRNVTAKDSAITTMAYTALTGFVVLTCLLPFVWITPTPFAMLMGLVMGLANTAGHWILVIAYRYGDASVLAPYAYVQLVAATVIGALAFGEFPTIWSLSGIAVIIISGIYAARLVRRPPAKTARG